MTVSGLLTVHPCRGDVLILGRGIYTHLPVPRLSGVTVFLWIHSPGGRSFRAYWERFYSLRLSFGLQAHSIIGRVGSSWRSLVPLPTLSGSILRFMISRSWSGGSRLGRSTRKSGRKR